MVSFADLRPRLHRIAQNLLARLFGVWVGPAYVAGLGTVDPDQRDEILGWLVPLERFARMLIAVWGGLEAAPVRPSAPRTLIRDEPILLREKIYPSADDPDSWRVRFSIGGSGFGGGGRGRRFPGDVEPEVDDYWIDAWPLARRMEAARRVVEDPAGYAAWLSGRAPEEPRRLDPEARAVRAWVEARRQEIAVEEAVALLAEIKAEWGIDTG